MTSTKITMITKMRSETNPVEILNCTNLQEHNCRLNRSDKIYLTSFKSVVMVIKVMMRTMMVIATVMAATKTILMKMISMTTTSIITTITMLYVIISGEKWFLSSASFSLSWFASRKIWKRSSEFQEMRHINPNELTRARFRWDVWSATSRIKRGSEQTSPATVVMISAFLTNYDNI